MNQSMNQAISAYKKATTSVAPMTAVVLLFDEILDSLAHAELALDAKRYDEGFERVQRSVTILRGLRSILNMEAGGLISQQLRETYTRNIFALNASVGKPDAAERLAKLAAGLLTLRDAWATIAGMALRTPQEPEGQVA